MFTVQMNISNTAGDVLIFNHQTAEGQLLEHCVSINYLANLSNLENYK